MARPTKNSMEWFPHANKMRNDRKVKALRARYGLEGYAVYNMILEVLCEADLLAIKWNEVEIELVSGDLTLVSDKLIEIIEYSCSINLLSMANGWLFCQKLDEKAENIFLKRKCDLHSFRKNNGVNLSETPVSATKTPDVPTSPVVSAAETPQSRVEKSIKEKEIYKEKRERGKSDAGRDIPPTLDCVKEFVSEKELTHVDPEEFMNYYSSVDWVVGRKKMKNWHSAVSGWNSRNKRDGKPPYIPIDSNKKTWRNDYAIYRDELREAFKRYIGDKEWMRRRQMFSPEGLNIEASLHKACEEILSREDGWREVSAKNHKDTVDWDRVFTDALSQQRNRLWQKRT